jgi:transcription antitermination factor NusG
MPIVAKDTDVSPPDLLLADLPASKQWYALHTRPRKDKVLMRRLFRMGKAFCGLLVPKRNRMPSGKVKTSYLPLFPNYVFLYGDADDRYDALTTDCVQRVLDVQAEEGQQLQTDLARIHDAILHGKSVTAVPFSEKGHPVRIVSGPLAGKEGIILQRRGKTRIVLSLTFLQQGAAIEIDEALVELQ